MRANRRCICAVGLAGALALVAPSLLAQSTGKLAGTVTDPEGAPVAFAMVTTISMNTGFVLPAATGTNGTYRFNLPAGKYRVRVESAGYKQVEIAAVSIGGPWTVVRNCDLRGIRKLKPIPSQRLLSSRRRARLPITRRSLRYRISVSPRLRPREARRSRRGLTGARTCSRCINGSA